MSAFNLLHPNHMMGGIDLHDAIMPPSTKKIPSIPHVVSAPLRGSVAGTGYSSTVKHAPKVQAYFADALQRSTDIGWLIPHVQYNTLIPFIMLDSKSKSEFADEIDVDKYGRVKVRFTWDRRLTSVEGKPTRFIRVSQGWAGQGYGMVLLPRVGDELIVSYLDGDPDEPIAVGRVHNAVYTSPLNLPDSDDITVSIWKSRSSPSDGTQEDRYNMVRMQDKSGEEMLELRAQRDYHQETLHDSNEEVGHNQTIRVKGGQSTSAGSISMSSGSTFTASAGTDMTLTAKGTLTAKAPTVVIEGKVTGVSGESALVLHGGTVLITSPTSVTITAPKVSVNGSDVVDVKGGVINLNC